jgi:hypothetical protein
MGRKTQGKLLAKARRLNEIFSQVNRLEIMLVLTPGL